MKAFKKSKKEVREAYDIKEIKGCIEKAEEMKKELYLQNICGRIFM